MYNSKLCKVEIPKNLSTRGFMLRLIKNLPHDVSITQLFNGANKCEVIFVSPNFKDINSYPSNSMPILFVNKVNATIDFSSVRICNVNHHTSPTQQELTADYMKAFDEYVPTSDVCKHEWTIYTSMISPKMNFEYCRKCGNKKQQQEGV